MGGGKKGSSTGIILKENQETDKDECVAGRLSE
jgi:hypothetical protein